MAVIFLDAFVVAHPQLARGPATALQRAENDTVNADEKRTHDGGRHGGVNKAAKRNEINGAPADLEAGQ